MCGIAGIYNYHYASCEVDREELLKIRDHMQARGPDGFGEWFSEDRHIAFGHRRLSIIDLHKRAAQPMVNEDSNCIVTFNGEIYNYQELRKKLETKGYRFKTTSDTEVLLHLYTEMGVDMLNELRGMFAFGIWDNKKKQLFLARDPYGIKPFYYADDGWTFRFASQVKAILAGGKVSRTSEPAGQVGFYLFGNIPEPYTSWQEIRALESGTYMIIDQAGIKKQHKYFSLSSVYKEAEILDAQFEKMECEQNIRKLFLDSVHHHIVSDTKVGAFLSAGIDSGALVALMKDAGLDEVETLTLAFSEQQGTHDDESLLAEQVAQRYKTKHTTRLITQGEFDEDLPKIINAMDQPSIDGINTWFISKAAKEQGLKVAISGVGGDELLGGYSTFSDVQKIMKYSRVPSKIPFSDQLFRLFSTKLLSQKTSSNPKLPGLLKYGRNLASAYYLKRGLFLPWELENVLDRETVYEGLRRLQPEKVVASELQSGVKDYRSKVSILESTIYMKNQLLRDTDWASMAHSLEIRTPLVDSYLLQKIVPYLLSQEKHNHKISLANSPTLPLPDTVTNREKTGFSIPVANWLQTNASTQQWKAVSTLTQPRCPWARRWAYSIAIQHFCPP